jgi:hypothetical protein
VLNVPQLSIPIYEITTLEKRMTAFVIPNAIRVKTPRADYTFASFLSRDTTFDVIHNIWRLARPGDAASIGSGSGGNVINIAEGTVIGGGGGGGGGAAATAGQGHKPTTCACGKEGSHFTEVAMDTVVPGTPDRIYNLMFASGFMKDFMAVNQKLLGTFPRVVNRRSAHLLFATASRYSGIRLGPDDAGFAAPGPQHVVYQTSHRESRAEADKVRDSG